MDHAKWMQDNIDACKRIFAKGKKRPKYPLPDKLSPFQERVCDILGIVGGGIYNAPIPSPDLIDWDHGFNGVSVTWSNRGLATFDYGPLTTLVFLCHEARIRCEIEAVSPRRFRLTFWQRTHDGGMARRHPNLDEAVAAFRAYMPGDHRIYYKTPEASAQKEGQ